MRGIDLFSGPGGLALGLKEAGIEPICAVEWNRDAIATYRQHTPDAEHHCADIRDVSFARFRGAADVVYGGPPCQPFSTGGLRHADGDARDMLPAFLAAVDTVSPRAVLMENVPGLAVKSRRHNLERVLASLDSQGYRVTWTILNAADFGVPQSRRRLFIVGMKDRAFRFPAPTHGEGASWPHVPASAIVRNESYGEPAKSPVFYAPVVDIRRSPYAGHVYKGGGRPLDLARPSYTVYASAGGNKTHWIDTLGIVPEYHRHLVDGGKTREGIVSGARRLSVEESALIQAFPREMTFVGSKSSRFTQVGDAVPPLLAAHLGRAIVAQLNGEEHEEHDDAQWLGQQTLLFERVACPTKK